MALYLIPLQLFVLARISLAFSEGRTPSMVAEFAVIAYSMTVQFIWLNYVIMPAPGSPTTIT
jgi:hypothetical protein